MPQVTDYPELQQTVQLRAEELFQENFRDNSTRADRLFAGLFLFQWLLGILLAFWISPRAWEGAESQTHSHVYVAIFVGGSIIAYPVVLIFFRPGASITRHAVAIAQMLTSSLLIHLTDGRIETHFHIFGSLAFLAFYRDWRVLITASAITAADHFLRGLLLPLSIYGEVAPSTWRWLEHAGYVVFEDIFLIISNVQSRRAMSHIALRQAQLEATKEIVESEVIARTRELKASEELTRFIVDTALDAVITIDADWRILRWNPQAEAIFGWTKEEALSQRLDETIIPEAGREEQRRTMETFQQTGVGAIFNRRIEITALRRNGEEFPIELAVSPLKLGDTYIFSAFVRDITERKMLETQLAHAQKMESVGQLATGIAHEINTPIQYIGDNIRFFQESIVELQAIRDKCDYLVANAPVGTSTAELLLQIQAAQQEADLDYLFDEIPKAVAQSLDGVGRVSSIVQAMKHFSHPGTAEKTPVDLNRSIESTITVARSEWKYLAELVTEFDTTLPLVSCLPGDFNQVILNLIVNASHAIADVVKETGNKGVITVSTRQEEDWVEIRIQDTGTGIPESARSKIFNPFFTTKEVGKGTGQGLSLAHAIIVEKHEGAITFETEMGRGTTFIIRIPLANPSTVWEKAA